MKSHKRGGPMEPVNTLGRSGNVTSFLQDEESGIEEDDQITNIRKSPCSVLKNMPDLSKPVEPEELTFEDLESDKAEKSISPLEPLLDINAQKFVEIENIEKIPGDLEVIRIHFNAEHVLTNQECWIKCKILRVPGSPAVVCIYVYRPAENNLITLKLAYSEHWSTGSFVLDARHNYIDLIISRLPNEVAFINFPIRTSGLMRLELTPYAHFDRMRLVTILGSNGIKDNIAGIDFDIALGSVQRSQIYCGELMSSVAKSRQPTVTEGAKKSVVDLDGHSTRKSVQDVFSQYSYLRQSPRLASLSAASKVRTTAYFDSLGTPKKLTSSASTTRRSSGIDWSVCEPAPIANPQLLFVYPDDSKSSNKKYSSNNNDNSNNNDSSNNKIEYMGSVAITSAELPRLEPGIFLNDRLIDFDLMFTHTLYQPKPNVHVFCSLFFHELKTMGREGVRKWTPKDLFQKRFLVIPVNEYLHWYLVIICNPQRLLVDITKKSKKRVICTVDAHEEEEEGDELEEMETIRPDDKCYILILDSLGSRARPNTIETLSNYLSEEALEKHNVQMNRKLLTGISPKVPQQDNHTDCGLFLLEFFERFVGKPDDFEANALRRTGNFYFGLRDWFKPETASARRGVLKTRVLQQQAEYQQQHPLMSEPIVESASSDLEIIE